MTNQSQRAFNAQNPLFFLPIACYRLLLEFPPTILKQYSVLNTAIFNLKHSSPDSTEKNFPVVFKMCSDTLFEIPRTTFLFPPCWDKIFGTTLGMEEFRFQKTPSSRLWCGLISYFRIPGSGLELACK